MTTTITFPDDFAPYRERVAALTQAIFDLRPGVLADVEALDNELEDRFVRPLRAEYNRVPFEQRAGNVDRQRSRGRDRVARRRLRRHP